MTVFRELGKTVVKPLDFHLVDDPIKPKRPISQLILEMVLNSENCNQGKLGFLSLDDDFPCSLTVSRQGGHTLVEARGTLDPGPVCLSGVGFVKP